MKLNKLFLIPGALVLVMLTGCVVPQWKEIQKPELTASGATYKIQAPVGWVALSGMKQQTLITKEGPAVQSIKVHQTPQEKAFEYIDKKISDNILISELANFYVAEIKAANPSIQVTLKETVPHTLDGKEGFKTTLEFRNEEGLIIDVIAYGLLFNKQFYTLVYHAPRLYYFERDLPVFNRVVESFKII